MDSESGMSDCSRFHFVSFVISERFTPVLCEVDNL